MKKILLFLISICLVATISYATTIKQEDQNLYLFHASRGMDNNVVPVKDFYTFLYAKILPLTPAKILTTFDGEGHNLREDGTFFREYTTIIEIVAGSEDLYEKLIAIGEEYEKTFAAQNVGVFIVELKNLNTALVLPSKK